MSYGDNVTKEITVALAGNPNVGKSTLFNSLTGMRQHTGNWSGKTVECASGDFVFENTKIHMVDLPGCYSLIAHSGEEEVARDFICFGDSHATLVVCDATCLRKNLNLVLQCIEMTERVVVCVNMMDEAKKRNISIDIDILEKQLGVPVFGMCARKKSGRGKMLSALCSDTPPCGKCPVYSDSAEAAVTAAENIFFPDADDKIRRRFFAIKLLCGETDTVKKGVEKYGYAFTENESEVCRILTEFGFGDTKTFSDAIAESLLEKAGEIADTATSGDNRRSSIDKRLDSIFCGRIWAYPTMLLVVAVIFWITLIGANGISSLLGNILFSFEDTLERFFVFCRIPDVVTSAVVHGMYRVLAWVVSVMLPPMAIFFPLFTILEDFGYLPRVAFNLDRGFQKCRACGKQALCMCMGFGCNAVGVSGARIIDTKRERLIAIMTNAFVPCNGRFPTIIAMITMFLVPMGILSYLCGSLIFISVIILSVAVTLAASLFLSKTFLRGTPGAFTLELPPYRTPDFKGVIVHSLLNRTLKVLLRAIAVAAPAGLVIWLLANINAGDRSLLCACSEFLDPFARLMGLDGTILFAFILGLPANEIVIPIIIMSYTGGSVLVEFENYSALRELFVANGWTVTTAVCTLIFTMFHWPCSTTVITTYKETKSFSHTALAVALPTVFGIIACIAIRTISLLF